MRMSQKAGLIPQAGFQAWYDQAILTPGLTSLELALLAAICAWYRRLDVDGFAGSLSIERMAHKIGAEPRDVRFAITHLVELGLIAGSRGAARGRTSIFLRYHPLI